MASEPAPSRVILTYADLCGMPDDGRRYELFEGEVYVTPAPRIVHQRISRNLELVLHSYVEQHGLGEVLYAPVDVILTDTTVVQPDLLYVSRPRLPIVREHGIVAAPDLVVEILSKSTAERDRGVKRQLYARYGVAHYWLVDPGERTLSEHLLQQGAYALKGVFNAGAVFTPTLFAGLSIDLGGVFPAP